MGWTEQGRRDAPALLRWLPDSVSPPFRSLILMPVSGVKSSPTTEPDCHAALAAIIEDSTSAIARRGEICFFIITPYKTRHINEAFANTLKFKHIGYGMRIKTILNN
jgi:hypothetical protein